MRKIRSLARTHNPLAALRNQALRLFAGKAFLSGASLLVVGTVAGQSAVILSAPVISRMYSPDEFGVLAVYAAVLAVSASLATMRYEVAIPLPKADGSATIMLVIASITVLVVTTLTSLAVILWGESLVQLTNTPDLAGYLWTVPVGVFLMGLHGVFMYWGLRKRAFSLVARTRVQQGVSMVVTQLVLGHTRIGALGLVIGHIVGFAGGVASLARFWYATGAKTTKSWSPSRMRKRVVRYRDYPLYSSWGGVVNTAGLHLPAILFASIYSPAVAGIFLLSNRVANAPVALVAEAVGKVFYVSAVDAKRQGRLAELVLTAFECLLKACLTPFLLIAIVGPSYFSTIFGDAWLDGGSFFQWLLILMASVFVFAPLAMLYSVLYRHREDLYFQCVLFVARISAIVLGANFGGPLVGIALFSLTASAVYIGFGFRLLSFAGVQAKALIKIVSWEALLTLTAGSVLYITREVIGSNVPGQVGKGDICLLVMTVATIGVALSRVRSSLRSMRNTSLIGLGKP